MVIRIQRNNTYKHLPQMQTHRKHLIQMSGTTTWLSSDGPAPYLEFRWMISTVLMCSELLTLTSLLKVRNIKPPNQKQKKNFRKNWKLLLIYFYNFEDSSSTKYNDLKEEIFLKFNLNSF